MPLTLSVKPGLSAPLVNAIPKEWDAQWFRRFITDYLNGDALFTKVFQGTPNQIVVTLAGGTITLSLAPNVILPAPPSGATLTIGGPLPLVLGPGTAGPAGNVTEEFFNDVGHQVFYTLLSSGNTGVPFTGGFTGEQAYISSSVPYSIGVGGRAAVLITTSGNVTVPVSASGVPFTVNTGGIGLNLGIHVVGNSNTTTLINVSNTGGGASTSSGIDLTDGTLTGSVLFQSATYVGFAPAHSLALTTGSNAAPIVIAPNFAIALTVGGAGNITMAAPVGGGTTLQVNANPGSLGIQVGQTTDASNSISIQAKGAGGAATLVLNSSGVEAVIFTNNQSGAALDGVPTGAVGIGTVAGQKFFFGNTGGVVVNAPTSGYALQLMGALALNSGPGTVGAAGLVVNQMINDVGHQVFYALLASGNTGTPLVGGFTGEQAYISSAVPFSIGVGGNAVMTISSTGNVVLHASSSGVTASISGVSGQPTLILNSANVALPTPDFEVIRSSAGTANTLAAGASINLTNNVNSGTIIQSSGNQTEIWQFNGAWFQAAFWNTNRTLTLTPGTGFALTANGDIGLTVNPSRIWVMPTGAGATNQAVLQFFSDNNLYIDAPATGTPAGGNTFLRTGVGGGFAVNVTISSAGYLAVGSIGSSPAVAGDLSVNEGGGIGAIYFGGSATARLAFGAGVFGFSAALSVGGAITNGDPAGNIIISSVTLANGAGAAAGTLTNAPIAGNPTKWAPINDHGTIRHIPVW